MTTTETKVPGTFTRVPGGYAQQISGNARLFIPEAFVSRFEDGTVYQITPDYEAIEASKAPAVVADKPGEYSYYYETQKAPVACDFSASLSYYGKHYFLRPLRSGLPKLHGRGITYDEAYNTYKVTENAYEKLKAQYRISYEMCFD